MGLLAAVGRVARSLEKWVCFVSLALLALVPFADLVLRQAGIHIQGFTRGIITHLFLVLVFLAAMITAKSSGGSSPFGGHISIGMALHARSERLRRVLVLAGTMIVVFVLTLLAWNSLPFIVYGLFRLGSGLAPVTLVGGIPAWVFALAMPLGYIVMALRFSLNLSVRWEKFAALAMILIGTAAAFPAIAELIWGTNIADVPEPFYSWIFRIELMSTRLMAPLIAVLILAALSGMPIFAAIGGIATVMLTAATPVSPTHPPAALHGPIYDMLTGIDLIAIPLFTLTGFFLSESRAGERLVRTFRVFFGWLPGGVIIVAVLISAFFSSFTGASGVTILALGGILYAIFRKNGYSESASMGLVTAAAGTGVMFPPSLAIILVFSTSSLILHFMHVPMDYTVVHFFAGAIIPGLILLATTIAVGALLAARGRGASAPVPSSVSLVPGSQKFDSREAFASVRESLLEILLPVVLVAGFFSGLLTLLEASAVSVVYVFVVEVLVKRDISLRDVPRVLSRAVPVVGGVLIVLAMASGLSFAFVDSGVPERFADWMRGTVDSRLAFLLLLNLALLLVGCVVDMFSAIMVLLPLVVPLGYAYGIDPLHLGIIFILNMEAGFLTPPVGINLFLAGSRFERPVMRICRYVMPFFAVRIAVLLLVSYLPWLSTWLPGLLAR